MEGFAGKMSAQGQDNQTQHTWASCLAPPALVWQLPSRSCGHEKNGARAGLTCICSPARALGIVPGWLIENLHSATFKQKHIQTNLPFPLLPRVNQYLHLDSLTAHACTCTYAYVCVCVYIHF